MGYRKYSDKERSDALLALDLNGGNVQGTAEKLGIPHRTLVEWDNARKAGGENTDIHNKKRRGDLAERLEVLIWELVDSIPGKIAAAGLKDTAIAIGILTDKAQLLKGAPTSIIATAEAQKTIELIMARTGLSEERAREIVAETLDFPEYLDSE
jgi:transposase-like protein